MENPIRFKGLDHVVLRVSDLGKALAFYRDVLGCAIEREVEEIGLVQLRAGTALIDLVPVDSPLGKQMGSGPSPDVKAGGRNMDHFALQIDPFNEQKLKAFLASNGLDAGEVARRYGAEGYGPSLYLSDPDGNVVELKGPPAD